MARSDSATIREVFQQTQRIEDKLDRAVDKMSERTEILEGRITVLLEKQDARLQKVEEEAAQQRGMNTILSALVGVIFGLVGSVIQGIFFKKA